ncbi:MAG TPA: sugar transferase [Polyangia bacterium]|nr:sugar transferase [Polyangia bacterium]
MTRDESLEAVLLVQYVALVVGSLLLARFFHVAAAHALPSLKPPVAPGEYAHLLVVYLPIWVFAAERLGIHRVRVLTGPRTELVRRLLITQAWGLAAVALILVAAQTALNRSLIAIFFAVSTVLLLVASSLLRRFAARQRGESLVLVIGGAGPEALQEIERARGRQVVRGDFGGPAELAQRLRDEPVDEAVLSEALSAEETRALVELLTEHGIPALVPLSRGVDGFPPPQVESVGRVQYLVYQRRRASVPSLVVKSIADRLLALVLVIVLGPVLLLLALLARLFVGTPVLYVQWRGGLYGRPFRMLKFRTMRVGADEERAALLAQNEMDGPVFKLTNDPRVTPFGRFLRRFSLDELPQLFNVLGGQMSLVGPRPLPVEETAALTGGHRRRLSMRPGLTCLWQVGGRSDLPFAAWMALDLDYVDRFSLGLDLAILLRTIPAILRGRGAR